MEYIRIFKWPSIYRVVCLIYVPLKPSYLHRFWSKKCFSHFCIETTNKKNQLSKCETWIFNAILDQTKLWRVLLWIRIEIMSGGPRTQAPPYTPLHIPDLKCDLNVFLILTFFSSNFRSFFNNRSNIFKNAFYVFFLLERWDRSW